MADEKAKGASQPEKAKLVKKPTDSVVIVFKDGPEGVKDVKFSYQGQPHVLVKGKPSDQLPRAAFDHLIGISASWGIKCTFELKELKAE